MNKYMASPIWYLIQCPILVMITPSMDKTSLKSSMVAYSLMLPMPTKGMIGALMSIFMGAVFNHKVVIGAVSVEKPSLSSHHHTLSIVISTMMSPQ